LKSQKIHQIILTVCLKIE